MIYVVFLSLTVFRGKRKKRGMYKTYLFEMKYFQWNATDRELERLG